MPGTSQLVTVTIDSSASNHPLSYFQPDPNGTWADGNWVTPAGSYTVHVGSSSANTPLQAAVNLNVVAPFSACNWFREQSACAAHPVE